MIRKNHEVIWYWYQKIKECNELGMSPKNYCAEYKLDYKTFCPMRYRIEFMKNTHPQEYKKYVRLTRNYISSGIPAAKFAKANKIDIKILNNMATHLRYLDIIDEFKNKEDATPMQFIQVPNSPETVAAPQWSGTTESLPLPSVQGSKPRPPMIQEQELMEKQNDIEINITKGVKVTISPNIDSMKIIKIIELLKDL